MASGSTGEWVNYRAQAAAWPAEGRVVLAHHTPEHVVVYQAFSDEIGKAAAREGRLDASPAFSRTRMTWIKPNFLWMMYRCGWARKDDRQTTVLAITISREGWETILRRGIVSAGAWEDRFASREEFTAAKKATDVQVQWDPDHDPMGEKEVRRAIQLGIRGRTLEQYLSEWTVGIEDITPMVCEQYEACVATGNLDALRMPEEREYVIEDAALRASLCMDRT